MLVVSRLTQPLRGGRSATLLPAYSRGLKPVEMAFAKLKAHLRRIGARKVDALNDAVPEILKLYSSSECQNDFKAAGYGSK